MKILLVNDDGIDAPFLAFAQQELQKRGQVYVVAPMEEQSGKSLSISMKDQEFVQKNDTVYALDGTPADCVNFGLFGLNLVPDLVVSGVNSGYNLGMDTKYSGTVGAALQANYQGYPAIAFSSDNRGDQLLRAHFLETLEYLMDKNLISPNYVLNVNFPLERSKKFRGFKHTNLYHLKYSYQGEIVGNRFRKKRKRLAEDLPKDSDRYAVENGYVSITKLYLA